MDISIFLELLGSVGFPIACVIALGMFILKIYKKSEERETLLMAEIAENRKINAEAIATITLYAERLTNIEGSVQEIKTDVNTIKEKL